MRIHKLISAINRFTEVLGTALSWISLLMVLLVVVVVVSRQLGVGSIALQEATTYLHALLFMLGLAFALKRQAHVRVDIFYRNYSERRKALVDVIGGVLLLLPFCGLILVSSWDYVMASWTIRESSSETEGIAAVYLLKTLMLIMPVTLAVQGIAEILSGILVLKNPSGTQQNPNPTGAGLQ